MPRPGHRHDRDDVRELVQHELLPVQGRLAVSVEHEILGLGLEPQSADAVLVVQVRELRDPQRASGALHGIDEIVEQEGLHEEEPIHPEIELGARGTEGESPSVSERATERESGSTRDFRSPEGQPPEPGTRGLRTEAVRDLFADQPIRKPKWARDQGFFGGDGGI